jgi:putative transposase
MTDNNVINLNKPEQNDPLQEVLREGARKRKRNLNPI